MKKGEPGAGQFRRGVVGMYALSLMERDGPLHGYLLSERIADRTEGSWRPGAGAVYPALRRLVERGWARTDARGRRREYRITPAGRTFLAQVRARNANLHRAGADLTVLMAEVMGAENVEEFLRQRLERALDGLARHAEGIETPEARSALRSELAEELERFARRLRTRSATSGALRVAPGVRGAA